MVWLIGKNKDMLQDKKPLNEKGQEHGYWERYYDNGTIWYKCNYINGAWYGYFEHHVFNTINKEYAAR